jgi:hypothetical protein
LPRSTEWTPFGFLKPIKERSICTHRYWVAQHSRSELVNRLKLQRPNVEVLYMSGFGEDGLRPEGAARLTNRFIQKPFRKTLCCAEWNCPPQRSLIENAARFRLL